jgi:hypothetical protein
VSSSEGRLPALLQAKLGALVADRWGEAAGDRGSFPSGATLLSPDRTTAWILVEDADDRILGPALAWARQHGAAQLHLLVDRAEPGVAGALARRATAFRTPVSVWEVEGRQLTEMAPAPLSPQPRLPASVAALADVVRAEGADPVVEFGVLTAEVLGLEVARAFVADDGDGRLEVGVGSQDREARQLMYPDQAPSEALAETVQLIRHMRRAQAPRHLANTLAPDRWLRAVLIAHPELVGAGLLASAPPSVPRQGLRSSRPAPAAGLDDHGEPVVVVASTGIDLDVVPSAADARLADGRSPRLIIALPEGDDHPAIRALAADLRDPAEIVTVPPGWRALSPVP